MLSHHLLKIKVQICDKFQTPCLVKRNIILLHGSADNAIVKLQQLLEMSVFWPHTL